MQHDVPLRCGLGELAAVSLLLLHEPPINNRFTFVPIDTLSESILGKRTALDFAKCHSQPRDAGERFPGESAAPTTFQKLFCYDCSFFSIVRRSPQPSRVTQTFHDCLLQAHGARL